MGGRAGEREGGRVRRREGGREGGRVRRREGGREKKMYNSLLESFTEWTDLPDPCTCSY